VSECGTQERGLCDLTRSTSTHRANPVDRVSWLGEP
jgi:hypothetical protein